MDLTKNIGGIIAGVIVIALLVTAVLMPVINSSTNDKITFTNDGVRMSPVGEDDVTITYDGNFTWTIAGEAYAAAERPITQGTIMFYGVGNSTRTAYMYINNNDTYTRHNVMNGDQDTIVYHGSTKTVDITTILASNGNTYSSTYPYVGEIYYYDEDGDYVWFGEKPTPAYIPDEWDRFNAWSIGSTNFYAIIGDSIMVDGVLSPEGVTYEDVIEDVAGISGVRKIESYTINIPDQDPIACRGYILPYQVTGTIGAMDNIAPILTMIPILITAGVLIGIVGAIFTRRE